MQHTKEVEFVIVEFARELETVAVVDDREETALLVLSLMALFGIRIKKSVKTMDIHTSNGATFLILGCHIIWN